LTDLFRSAIICLPNSTKEENHHDGAVRVGILAASGEGYNIHRRLGFQDYCQVNIYLGPMDEKSNEEETS
jgi:hypothetical protein